MVCAALVTNEALASPANPSMSKAHDVGTGCTTALGPVPAAPTQAIAPGPKRALACRHEAVQQVPIWNLRMNVEREMSEHRNHVLPTPGLPRRTMALPLFSAPSAGEFCNELIIFSTAANPTTVGLE